MVAVHPFCALRYNPERVRDLGTVIAPPYDVIDPDEQEQLYAACPYNIVRLILGKQYPSDTPEDNRYTRAQRDFRAWCDVQILRADPQPALYLVEHTFEHGGRPGARLGFLGLLELRDATERVVYRHEDTLAAPKQDRTKLLEALPANLCPIFCVYPDEGRHLHTMLEERARRAPPTAQATITGEAIRLWVVTESALIQEIASRLSSVAVLIADGHHRFEVAYANRSRYGALMTYFVSMEDPALVVQPIHRVVQRDGHPDLQALRTLGRVERADDLASVMRWLNEGNEEGRFGCYAGQTLYRLTLDPERLARWLMAPPVPLPLATLDVSLLHGLVLTSLNLNGSGLGYTANASQALQMVNGGQGSSAWLLRGISLQQVYALAGQGFTLPPKSTYFYPKVPSGLAINPLVALTI